jgi:hypothetical protein
MTNWTADVDALVEETMALVKNNRVEPSAPRTILEPPVRRAVTEPKRLPLVSLPKSEGDEIRQRVANSRHT